MELYKLTKDVDVFCVEATSFPKGIKAAFNKLSSMADMGGRSIFGISKPLNGLIRYCAAASAKVDGEAAKLGCPAFAIPKGIYLGETLLDWQTNEMMIMGIFDRLLADKRLDGLAYCIEWYKSPDELLCMVLMRSDEINGEELNDITPSLNNLELKQ